MNTLLPVTRLFDAAFAPGADHLVDPSNRTASRIPRADILEGDADFMIVMDLPGVTADDLDINVEDATLTVKAEREFASQDGYRPLRKELPRKVALSRSFNLGKSVDSDKIAAKLDRGVLVVTLPKSERVMPRRIDVE
jgi:HSP20 family protein